ncbi:hypothetical protein ACPOL_7226 (plasmid) [Acidisarcina polymorpha]|uniref:Uncharacterized protein n=1 Tax=Acidisarcina polymorpha TaxID=2211140 RepID=A0A2Z5GCV8_9BACT|nr:hypothetical protein [Acidisarcina polymorpha]AXC16416.1 hypothetical protein ACPOL_7226 [Acidisarcina polymorpha]
MSAIENGTSATSVKGLWIRDLVAYAFPEGEERERFLVDLVDHFAKIDPDDPEWLRYKLTVVECRALERMGEGLAQATEEMGKMRGSFREIADFSALQLRRNITDAGASTRELLEDVQASMRNAIAGESIMKSYTDETRQRFSAVIKEIIETSLERALTQAQVHMDVWVKTELDRSVREARLVLTGVTRDFRVKLFGGWGRLLFGCIAIGVLVSGGLLWLGMFLAKHGVI